MKKNILLTLLSILFVSISYAQIDTIGFPLIKNYSYIDYNGEPQIWDVVQNKNGIIYFGNATGVMEFDGLFWNTYPMDNKSTVKQLFLDKNNILYIGAKNEFGYLEITPNGSRKYKSLLHLLPTEEKTFGEIRSINEYNAQIIFTTKTKFFILFCSENSETR